jgi:hypothetical protein
MMLFSNEKVISNFRNGITLTNQRVHMNDFNEGRKYKITIALEDISSIQQLHKSNPILLILAVLAALGTLYGMSNSNNEQVGLFAVLAVVFAIAYLLTRHQIVSIHPNGGRPLEFKI